MPPNQPHSDHLYDAAQSSKEELRRIIIGMAYRELDLLVLLGSAGVSSRPYRQADVLLNQVIRPLENGNHRPAQNALADFLQEWPLYRIMRSLVNDVMPALRKIVYAEERLAELRNPHSANSD